MVIGDQFSQFLEKRGGLHASQIPTVLSVFVTVKWATSVAFILGGIRFRPLKRIFGEGEKRFNKAIIDNKENQGRLANQLRRMDRNRTAFRGKHDIEQTNIAWGWMGENYRKYSNIFGDQIAGNAAFQKVAKATNVDPRNLALGVAEGLICYKATFLIHAPLELYLVVKMFQIREEEEDMTIGEEVGREVGELLDAVATVYDGEDEDDKEDDEGNNKKK